jgi:hypothetical protein
LGWNTRPFYVLAAAISIYAALTFKSPYGLLVGLVVALPRWKCTVVINDWSGRLLNLAASTVATEGARRVGVELAHSQAKVVFIPETEPPFGIRLKPDYSVSAVFICDAFMAVYCGSSLALPELELELAATGDEVYFRHVSAVNYRDSSIEVVLSQGKKTKQIPVGSEVNAAAMLEAIRAKLRNPSQASPLPPAVTPIPIPQCVAPVQPVSDVKADGETRHCYLRLTKLSEYYADPAVVLALLDRLQVPGTSSTLKAMTHRERQQAIENQIDHFRRTPNSFWYGASQLEVLAASIWRARGDSLRDRSVRDKFCDVAREEDLTRPVARWLLARGEEPYMEIPMGRRRIDVLGHKRAGIMNKARITAVELKNDDEQFRRGPDQMATFAEYAHTVYLACTPAFAAYYLEKNAENRNVNHWDAGLLDRKLKQGGFGLLIVERDSVFEVIKPLERTPDDSRTSKVIASLTDFQRVELDEQVG